MQIGATLGGIAASGSDKAGPAAADPSLEKAAQAFEAIFLRQMIGAMRSSSLADGMFDSSATEQFQTMADARTVDEMSWTGGFGIAEMLLKQFAPATPLTSANPGTNTDAGSGDNSGMKAGTTARATAKDEQP